MAEVWKAQDEMLHRTVAIKVVLETLISEQEFVDRFLREARVAAGLEHPNIPQIFDVGIHEGRPFLVSPLLAGGSLADRLKGIVPFDLATSWLKQLASALDHAHTRGIVHRDVKPANALFDKNDKLFLTDFGLAKSMEESAGLTQTGAVIGTPAFMSPEQATGDPIGPHSDQFSLGLIAYRFLTGRLPFERMATPVILHKIIYEPVPLPSEFQGSLPRGVDVVISKALAKRPEKRYPSCEAFVSDLEKAIAQPGLFVVQPNPEDQSTPSVPFDILHQETGVGLVSPLARDSSRPQFKTEAAVPPIGDTPSKAREGPSSARIPGRPPESRGDSGVSSPSQAKSRARLENQPSGAGSRVSRPATPPSAVVTQVTKPLDKRLLAFGAGGLLLLIVVASLVFGGKKKEPVASPSAPVATAVPVATRAAAALPVGTPVVTPDATPAALNGEAAKGFSVTPKEAVLESVGVGMSGSLYSFVFSFDRSVQRTQKNSLRISSIRVLSRGKKELSPSAGPEKPYVLAFRAAAGNTLSFSLPVETTSFKGDEVLMSGDTLQLEWAADPPFTRKTVFAVVTSSR